MPKTTLISDSHSQTTGFDAVKDAAMEAGAHGCTISGAGPTMVAIVSDESTAHSVSKAMSTAFKTKADKDSSAVVTRLNRVGAQRVD